MAPYFEETPAQPQASSKLCDVDDVPIKEESEEEDEKDSNDDDDGSEDDEPSSVPMAMPYASTPLLPSYPYYYGHYSTETKGLASTTTKNDALSLSTVKTFPEKLHQILEFAAGNGLTDVISFFPHGRAFAIHMVCL